MDREQAVAWMNFPKQASLFILKRGGIMFGRISVLRFVRAKTVSGMSAATIQAVLIVVMVLAGNATADVAATSPGRDVSASSQATHSQRSWVVDMRRNDGDPQRRTCLSGIFARDAAYYPMHDHIDNGSLKHVDRWFSDGRGGSCRQLGFIWKSFGEHRVCVRWTPYCAIPPCNFH